MIKMTIKSKECCRTGVLIEKQFEKDAECIGYLLEFYINDTLTSDDGVVLLDEISEILEKEDEKNLFQERIENANLKYDLNTSITPIEDQPYYVFFQRGIGYMFPQNINDEKLIEIIQDAINSGDNECYIDRICSQKAYEKICGMEPVTLAEWNAAQDHAESINEILPYPMEYEEGCELDDVFVLGKVISPHYHQKVRYTYIPESLQEKLIAEKNLTKTTRYHNWTSELTKIEETTYNSEEDLLESFDEFVKEFGHEDVYITYEAEEDEEGVWTIDITVQWQ